MPDIFVEGDLIKKEEELDVEEKAVEAVKEQPVETAKETSSKPPIEIKATKHSHIHLFDSYCENPPNIKLTEGLEEEEVLLFLRRHFITNIPWMIKALIFLLLPLLLLFVNSLGVLPKNIFSNIYAVFIALGYYLLIAQYIFTSYLTWFYNISLVTTERILDIDFSSIVFENVAATKLSLVEDVTYQQVGVLRSIFDYGDVFVQTAGESREFDFLAVPHPEKVIKIINSMTGEHKK